MTVLLGELQRMIATEGPISVERYMALCLGHPVHGYYMTRDPLGAAGDFTTAPEISQMFGELIGLWAAEVWGRMGSPHPFRLVELGPGRGTLMSDLLRATRVVPGFREAAEVHLVEMSPALRAEQEKRLSAGAGPVAWHEHLSEVPEGPAVIIANEFIDALPVRQFVNTERGWCERLIGLRPEGGLTFGLAAEPQPQGPAGALGDILEWPAAAWEIVREMAARIASYDGAALVIDYGYVGPAFGDTLQAVKRHSFADPLNDPGEADLTVQVDFAQIAKAARGAGAAVHGPVGQGDWLRWLGIEARASALRARATAGQARDIDAALRRLTRDGPGEMGVLFKVMALAHPNLGALPGFPDTPVIPGLAEGENPEPTTGCHAPWIPGSRFAHPGMTGRLPSNSGPTHPPC